MAVFFISLIACVAVSAGEDNFFLDLCNVKGQLCNYTNGVCEDKNICTCNAGYTPTGEICISSTFKPDDSDKQNYASNYENGVCVKENAVDKCHRLHAECAGTINDIKCKCAPGYFKDSVCVRSSFVTDTCTTPGTLCSDSNGTCIEGTCVCKSGYFAKRDKCVKSRFAPQGGCSTALCGALKGRCRYGICQCEPFHYVENGVCISDSVEDRNGCNYKINQPCSNGRGICGRLNRCICNVGFVAGGNQCEARSFMPPGVCPILQECSDGLGVCQEGNICKCKGTGYVRVGQCVNDSFESQECQGGPTWCSSAMGLCKSNSVCHCQGKHRNWASKDTCISDTFSAKACTSAGLECSYNNGVCEKDGVCRCRSSLYVVGKEAGEVCSAKHPDWKTVLTDSTFTLVPKMRVLIASFVAVILAVFSL